MAPHSPLLSKFTQFFSLGRSEKLLIGHPISIGSKVTRRFTCEIFTFRRMKQRYVFFKKASPVWVVPMICGHFCSYPYWLDQGEAEKLLIGDPVNIGWKVTRRFIYEVLTCGRLKQGYIFLKTASLVWVVPLIGGHFCCLHNRLDHCQSEKLLIEDPVSIGWKVTRRYRAYMCNLNIS